MATASYENWLNRKKGKQSGDYFKLDTKNKTPEQNIAEIIQGLYVKKVVQNETSPTSKMGPADFRPGLRNIQKSSSDSRRLSYLNALVTLLCKEDRNSLGFAVDELMTCIRISLVDESMVIRAAALRVLRYLIKTESDVATFNTLKLPYLVVRSMDLIVRNEEERAQALRVVRRVIGVVGATPTQPRRHRAAHIDPGLLRCLTAVARAGSAGDGTGDRLARPAIATLAEICVLNPELFIAIGGVSAVTRQLAECATPRMAEALCGVLLHTLNEPGPRRLARVDLTGLSSPYCDFHVRPAGTDSTRDEREMRFTCSRLSLVCVLRSWPGLLHFCHPHAASGLRALVAALALPRLEVRKAILDLLYELVGLPQPEWTDEISVALDAVDPSDFQDSWRLNEGFVAAEGTAILPHLSSTGPDITEIHLALLLQCFLEAGLLDGLAEVIVTSDTFISVRATVLLGQLLHLIHLFLPPQLCSITPALPSLMSQASEGKPQALAAVAALRKLHTMLEARPASNSLFLDHIIQYCSGAFREREEDTTKSKKEKDNANMAKPKQSLYKESSIEFLDESDNESSPKQRHSVGSRADVGSRNVAAIVKSKSVSARTSAAVSKVTKTAKFLNIFERDSDSLIRCTLVMQNKDGNTWNWEIIRTILKENESEQILNLSESTHKAWVGRVVNYLMPSCNKYSHTDLSATCHGHSATRAGCQLIRHLLRHNHPDSQRLLEDLFYDVSRQVEAIETGRKAHECLFSPQHMCNTMCQMYFLFIGQLCHSQTGLMLFQQTSLYENLLELSTKTHHSCYVKLVISSLDYTLDSHPRDILAKTLTCNIQASRLYATQFLNVLLRASRKSKELVRRKSKLKNNLVQEHLRSHKEDSGFTGVDMDTWILKMLIGQVKDESKVVVKTALSILEEAFSVSAFVEKMLPMRDTLCQNCRLDKSAEPSALDFSAVGDRGYLLWLSLEITAATQSGDAKAVAFIKKHLDYWTKSYNYRYVRLVEAGVHEALTLCEGARPARARRAARPPPHLHATLAGLAAPSARPAAALAKALLAATLPTHYKILQLKKCTSEQEIVDLKASLWAVGNTAVTAQGLQQLMHLTNGYLEDSVPVHVVRLAKYCPVYSIRATAFYVLGLFGSTYDGANLLSDLGWLCVRHTRHDIFPIIPDEINLNYETNVHNPIASPDRRYNAFDVDISEHSDHTDQSVAESLQSDSLKQKSDDQDVVDHKDGRRETDKRKSHTLPIQGCSSSRDRPTLSESQTVDILRDCAIYERPPAATRGDSRLLVSRQMSLEHHEGRVRNTSESSTSGVSSCDSFLGKYAIPDRVLTLSPIPSSSSLYGMKSTSSSQRAKISDLQRRTSTSSFTTPDVASSPPSQMDMTGYATLKSLNKNRRPHLSESAATGSSEIDEISWLLTDSNRRSKPFSSLRDRAKSTRERLTKMSLLDYDWKPLSLVEGRQSPPPPPRAPRRAPPPPPPLARPPAYIGICLPRDLMELFPREEEVEGKAAEAARRARVPSLLVDSSTASDNKSRATPDTQKLPVPAYRGGDVVRAAANLVAGPSASRLGLFGNPRDMNIPNTEPNSGIFAIATLSSNTKANDCRLSSNPNTNKLPTGEAKDSIEKLNIVETNEIYHEKSHVDKGGGGDGVDGKDMSKISSAGEPSANQTSTGGRLDVITEVTCANVSTSASDTGAPSTSTSGIRSNVSTTASDAGTKSSAAGSDVGTLSKKAGGAKPSGTAVNTSAPASEAGNESTAGSRVERWRHCAADCLACVPIRPPSSHELREAFFTGVDSSLEAHSSPIPERSPQAELLHHAFFMANPIHLKQTRCALLSLKQRHPEVFRSACVYSDVCALLARDTYMLCARRFLQELFLDTNFDCFSDAPHAILSRHHAPLTSTVNTKYVGSRADVGSRNVAAIVKSKSVSARTSAAVSKVTKTAKFLNIFERDSDSLIRCTLVMQNKDGNTWNWEIIRTILKENESEQILNLSESTHKAWVGRVVNYLMPSCNKYSHTDLSATCHGHSATRAGCQLIRHLLRHNHPDSQRLLEDLFYDVSRQVEAIETGRKAHECLFSPQHMCNTMCQMYFLFIGQLCHSQTGLMLFQQTSLYENLLELSTKTHHSCYVKLVISSLDYTLDSHPRDILAKTLTCNIQASRLYATQFLNVLLRASRKSKELVRRKSKLKNNLVQEHLRSHKEDSGFTGVDMDTWILKMLIGQVKDESKVVVKTALSILEEAFSVSAFVEKMLPMRDTLCQNCRLDKSAEPSALDFSAVGDRGYLLWLSLEITAATQSGDAKAVAFIKKHLDYWTKSYNYRYVRLVEAGVHEALTLCEGARPARARRAARPPPHLHATLAGLAAPSARPAAALAKALLAATLPTHYKILQLKKCTSEQEIVDLKASLWAVGNTAVTAQGLQQLMHLTNGYLEDSVPVHVVRLAKYCPVYSIRATAFYVLGLFGSTYDGANLLSDLGWLCVRHTRHDIFPIIPDEINLNYETNVHNPIASPDRRYNAFDVDISEHSDHTDQSVAESLQSDSLKQKSDDQDVVDHKDGRRETDKRKSHTLPIQGCSSSRDRPTLSESQTVDILRDCAIYERPPAATRGDSRLLVSRQMSLEHHEGRVRNTSESSTSGVSSCDSFLGKYAIPDRVLTLSPIPSSSSLYGMKSTSSSQRAKISDLQRRTSTSSFTTPDVASSPPSQMDMTGYATLKSLNKNRRPHLSESAATGSSEIDEISWLLTDSNRRSKPFSSLRDRAKSTRERLTKMSLLDYDWKPLSLVEGRQSPPPPPRAPRRAPPPPPPLARPPAYIGICLPRDLMELFPREEEVEGKAAEAARRARVPSLLVDSSTASDNKSRATPDTQKLPVPAYRGGDVVRAAANLVAGPSASRLGLFGNPRDMNIPNTEPNSGIFAIATLSSNTKANDCRLSSNPNTNKLPTGEAKDSIEKLNIVETNEIYHEKSHVDKGGGGDGVDGKDMSKISSAGEPSANQTSTGGRLDVITEVTCANVSTSASDTGAPSTSTSGIRSNVSTTASDAGTKSSAAGSDVGTLSKKAGGAKPSGTAVNTSAPASEAGNESTAGSRVERWRHCAADCLACVPIRPPSSHELREAFFTGVDSSLEAHSSPIPERSPQAELLHHAFFMANPIHLKQTRCALLSLKQRHPEVFRSACVYSDVCALLARDTYMLCARRFLQELFLDTNFDCFSDAPHAILSRHHAPLTSTVNTKYVGSRADVGSRNVAAIVKSKSVSARTSAAVSKVTKTAKFLNIFERDSDSLIRCTLVMQNKDGNTWNWEIIRTILRPRSYENESEQILNLSESTHKAWVGRVVNYLMPSCNKYSHTDLSATCHGHSATRAGCQLIRHLLRHNHPDSQRLLEDLFYDVSRQVEAIETGRKAHECLFSPQHMCNTMCQMYFLFIGQLCHSQTGLMLFQQTSLYENLLELSTKTHHSCYVKLVISSLDYTLDSHPRDILAKTLTCNIQASRLYATQFLNVLLRASRKSKELVRRKSKLKNNLVQEHLRSHKEDSGFTGVDMDTWILKMLIGQVKDESKVVVKTALSILEEAFSVSAFVEKMLPMRDTLCQNCRLDKSAEPSALDFSAVGDRGYLLWLSLEITAATQSGDAKAVAFIKKHLDYWTKSYNYRYVRLVEAGVHEALTLCEGARPARARRAARPPPHLHATLAGLAAPSARPAAALAKALLAATLPTHYKILQRKKCTSEQEIVDLKASLWAVGNTAVTAQGLQQLMHLTNGYLEDSVPVHVVRLAKYCPVYSIRATAFYVLGLFGSTYDGANLLSDLGWLCVRHTRHDIFPIIPDEINLNYETNVHNPIASPDRRYNAFDVDISEHSDHTDQSVAESLQSDSLKQKTDDQDVVDHKDGRRETDKRKSHTLPIQGCSSSRDRPTLSESQTVDILRDCAIYERPPAATRGDSRLLVSRQMSLEHHEGRVRNTSESSTSGVSSCDSFLGKYAIPDRVLTLSPIPSSSSLYGMKSTSSSQRAKISDLQRRTSTSSFTTPDVASSPPSQMDMTGYATLKSLNKNRRPHLSESAATGSSEIDEISWLLTDSNRRSKPFSSLRDRAKSTRERLTKMSLLDYDWKPLSLLEGRQSPPPPPRAPRRAPPAPLARPPAYIGICLPRDLMELFPREEEVEGKAAEAARRARVPSLLVDSSTASDNKSRATPDTQKLPVPAYRGGDVVRAAANFVAGPSASRLGLFGNPRDMNIPNTEPNSSIFAIATLSSNTKANDCRLSSNPNTNKPPTGEAKDSIEKLNIVETNEIYHEKSHVDKGGGGDGVDGKDMSKISSAGEPSANQTSTGGRLDVITEVTCANVSTSASDTGAPSTSTSGIRSNVSTTASDAGTKSSAAGSDVGTLSKKAGGAKPSGTAVNTSAPASEAGNESTAGSRVERWRHCAADCLACVPIRPPSSHELREAFFTGVDSSLEAHSSPIPERSPQAELLHHAFFMANPIHLKQTRCALLSLKQRHPEVFRSACVYSDVCALLARDTYMLCARRFLQELFLDTNFDCFSNAPHAILSRHHAPLTSTVNTK